MDIHLYFSAVYIRSGFAGSFGTQELTVLDGEGEVGADKAS